MNSLQDFPLLQRSLPQNQPHNALRLLHSFRVPARVQIAGRQAKMSRVGARTGRLQNPAVQQLAWRAGHRQLHVLPGPAELHDLPHEAELRRQHHHSLLARLGHPVCRG